MLQTTKPQQMRIVASLRRVLSDRFFSAEQFSLSSKNNCFSRRNSANFGKQRTKNLTWLFAEKMACFAFSAILKSINKARRSFLLYKQTNEVRVEMLSFQCSRNSSQFAALSEAKSRVWLFVGKQFSTHIPTLRLQCLFLMSRELIHKTASALRLRLLRRWLREFLRFVASTPLHLAAGKAMQAQFICLLGADSISKLATLVLIQLRATSKSKNLNSLHERK